MPLINETLTPAQKAAKTIRSESALLHTVMLNSHQVIFNALWNTPGVDPQDVLDLLGTDSGSLFEAGGLAVQIILTQNPSALTPEQYTPPRAPTVNEDGTVTLAPIEDP